MSYPGTLDELHDALEYMRSTAIRTDPPLWFKDLAVRRFRKCPDYQSYVEEWENDQ
jgi:hypothetical protein